MKLKRITETTKKLEGLTGELGLVSLLKKGLIIVTRKGLRNGCFKNTT